MPSISMHMHFAKVLIENITFDIDLNNYIIGILSPKTIYDEIDEYHTADEDGNVDVREFYEKFNFSSLSIKEKSFILGYYSNLWLEEYYKFNANKLIIHNKCFSSDDELYNELKKSIDYYNRKAIGNYFDNLKSTAIDNKQIVKPSSLDYIDIDMAKKLLANYFSSTEPKNIHNELVNEGEYISFIKKGCKKLIKSL